MYYPMPVLPFLYVCKSYCSSRYNLYLYPLLIYIYTLFTCYVAQDIIFHIVWILFWFIASVGWAVAFNRLDNLLSDFMDTVRDDDCASLINDLIEYDRDSAIYIQAQIAVVSQLVDRCHRLWLVHLCTWVDSGYIHTCPLVNVSYCEPAVASLPGSPSVHAFNNCEW